MYTLRILRPTKQRQIETVEVAFQEKSRAIAEGQRLAKNLRLVVDLFVDGKWTRHFFPGA